MYTFLLVLHIVFGVSALCAAGMALFSVKGDRRHINAGLAFVAAMLVISTTAATMTLLKQNLFLLSVALFSFYLVGSGWLHARNHQQAPLMAEWIMAIGMIITGIVMALAGLQWLWSNDSMGIVLILFGGIGSVLAITDILLFRNPQHYANARIKTHLTKMLGGTIAVLTAVSVVNISIEPKFIVWITPTLIITPVIIYYRAAYAKI